MNRTAKKQTLAALSSGDCDHAEHEQSIYEGLLFEVPYERMTALPNEEDVEILKESSERSGERASGTTVRDEGWSLVKTRKRHTGVGPSGACPSGGKQPAKGPVMKPRKDSVTVTGTRTGLGKKPR